MTNLKLNPTAITKPKMRCLPSLMTYSAGIQKNLSSLRGITLLEVMAHMEGILN